MLPQSNKLRSSRGFMVTVRCGRRIGRKTSVLHIRDTAASGGEDKADMQIIRLSGPYISLIVSKAVDNAVAHRAVSRKLCHVMAAATRDLLSATDIVVRTLPASATATSQELSRDVQSAPTTYERRR